MRYDFVENRTEIQTNHGLPWPHSKCGWENADKGNTSTTPSLFSYNHIEIYVYEIIAHNQCLS